MGASEREFGKLRSLGRGQWTHHNINHSKVNHCFRRFWMEFIILAHATKSSHPGEGALHDPAMGQELETLDVVRSFHDFQDPTALALDPLHQLACVTAVGPNQLKPREVVLDLLENGLRPIPILDPRGMNRHRQDQPHRVHQDVTLAPRDLLAGIVSIDPPLFVCLRRLTVDARRARFLLSARCNANPSTKGVVNPLKGAVTGPRSKVVVDGPRRGKVVGQEPPGTPRSQQVEDRVEHLADVRGAGPTATLGGGKGRFDNRPLFLGKIALVPLPRRSLVHDRAPPCFVDE